jgi:hypothetical protein
MRKTRFAILLAAFTLALAPLALAQDGYGDIPADLQSKNIPAGTVNEPGSQLIFLLDTGLDAKAMYSGQELYGSQSVSDFNSANNSALFQNFVSITNTNPTDAVTVHFRLINSNCTDIIDFLVVLTCNDTMLIDPFDYEIPGSGGINVKDRLFGSVSATPYAGITASLFDDGRFFLFVTASGDLVDDADSRADWLFPYGLAGADLSDDCTAVDPGTIGEAPVSGEVPIRPNDLHVLNASAISFNYLTGFYSIAIPTDLIGGDLPEGANDLAYGTRAYVRPAVSLAGDRYSDGDGPHAAPKGVVLSGTESIPLTNAIPGQAGYSGSTPNTFYLRSEIQGGFHTGDDVLGGALSWTLYPIEGVVQGALPSEQFLYLVSLVDDYNGSNNIKKSATVPFNDNSYGMDSADSLFDVLVFNNDEELLELPLPDVPVSPPPPFTPISLVINVRCIDTWDATLSTNFGTFSVADLFTLGGGSDVADFLASPVDTNDELGPGWLRLDRVRTDLVESYDGVDPTYFTAGQSVVRFEGFAISWWLPASATNRLVAP